MGAAFLFYRSWYGLFLAVGIIPLCIHRDRKARKMMQEQSLKRQFISGMQVVAASLSAGYSMESAWQIAQKDMEKLYGQEAVFCRELRGMNQKMAMNEPLEPLLTDFARRSEIEDIRNFAEIFQYAKRSGGNLREIIRDTIAGMQEKADILDEIATAVSARKMEQKMMNLLMPGILLFITLSSPEYVDCLYHNEVGVLAMTVCLAGYVASCLWSEKIMDIEV